MDDRETAREHLARWGASWGGDGAIDMLVAAISAERQRCLDAIRSAPALDENGYICEKSKAMEAILDEQNVADCDKGA